MQATVFHAFRDLAYRLSGISLRDGSETLVSARVAERMRALELRSEEEYLALLSGDDATSEAVHFVDAISTGFTSFWREGDHFEQLAADARTDLAGGQQRFRYWSAACSSGQEPFSMAIALDAAFDGLAIDWKILATDLSTRRLRRACAAVYNEEELAPLSPDVRSRCFTKAGSHRLFGPLFQLVPALRARVVFRRLNLAQPELPMRGPLDAVFCRNVMFYFDVPVRQMLVNEIDRLLKPAGRLYIGHSETLSQLSTKLRPVEPAVYVKAVAPHG